MRRGNRPAEKFCIGCAAPGRRNSRAGRVVATFLHWRRGPRSCTVFASKRVDAPLQPGRGLLKENPSCRHTEIVIVSAKRTAVGSFNGAFANTPAHELGAAAIKAALERRKSRPAEVDEVILGQILSGRRRARTRRAKRR